MINGIYQLQKWEGEEFFYVRSLIGRPDMEGLAKDFVHVVPVSDGPFILCWRLRDARTGIGSGASSLAGLTCEAFYLSWRSPDTFLYDHAISVCLRRSIWLTTGYLSHNSGLREAWEPRGGDIAAAGAHALAAAAINHFNLWLPE